MRDDPSGSYYYLNNNNITDSGIEIHETDRRISKLSFDQIRRRTGLSKGDVVIATCGTLGKTQIITEEPECYEFSRSVGIIKPNQAKLTSEYLHYYFQLPETQHRIQQIATGGVQKHFYIEDIEEFEIDLPDYEQQIPITRILSALDAKIANNKKLMAELDATARLMYDYWFTQFDFPDENGNPYRSSGGKMVWSDELKRDIPVNWETGSLEDIATLASGATPSTSEPSNYSTEGIAWITPDDLSRATGGMFIGHGKRDVSLSGLQSCSATLLPKGSIILSSRAPIGYLAIALENCCTNQGCKSFIPEMGYGSYFIFFMLGRMMPLIKSQGAGTTFKEVSKDTLSKLRVLLPPKPVVALFEQTIEGICGEMRSLQAEAESLANLRDWLLPMLMNGQTQVTD